MKIIICQYNPLVGDVPGMRGAYAPQLDATAKDAPDLIVFPELFIQGYPPRDLLEQRWFIRNGLEAFEPI